MPTQGHTYISDAARVLVGTDWAWSRKLEGYSIRQIAAMSLEGLGYEVGHSAIGEWVNLRADEITAENAGKREQLRQAELAKLDMLEARYQAVMDATHYVTNAGKLVEGPDGGLLVDDGPVLAAGAAKLRVQERRAKLEGYDAAVSVHVAGEVTYQIVGVPIEEIS